MESHLIIHLFQTVCHSLSFSFSLSDTHKQSLSLALFKAYILSIYVSEALKVTRRELEKQEKQETCFKDTSAKEIKRGANDKMKRGPAAVTSMRSCVTREGGGRSPSA